MTHAEELVQPALLTSLDEKKRISTRWISQALGKQHKHVLTDARKFVESGCRDLGNRIEFVSYGLNNAKEALMPLSDALIMMSQYQGQKAVKARDFVRRAVDYFIECAPLLEQEVRELRHRIAILEARLLPKPSTIPVTVDFVKVTNLWGEEQLVPVKKPRLMARLSELQYLRARLAHVLCTIDGLSYRARGLNERIQAHELMA